MSCSGTRPSLPARTRSPRSGRSWTRSWPSGSATGLRSRTTPRGRGGPWPPTSSSTATAGPGDDIEHDAAGRPLARRRRLHRRDRAAARGDAGVSPPGRALRSAYEPDAGRDGLDVDLSVQCFPIESETRHVCTEVIELHLLGTRAAVPASIVEPLLVSDLPVFSRWRGRPSFGASEFEQMMDVVDRLIVDSAEWPDVPEAYAEFQNCFERAAVSDIAWRRLLGWRVSLGAMWPGIAELDAIAVKGPKADALLLVGWLRSRLGRKVELEV